jgi:hypothetical protein
MTKASKPNGGPTERGIAELTPDAIKVDGHSVAEHIRALGRKAFTEGEDVAAYAEEVASAVQEATSQIADRVAALMESFQAARESMKQHQAALSALPERKALPPPEPTPARQAGIDAVEKSLGDLKATVHDKA